MSKLAAKVFGTFSPVFAGIHGPRCCSATTGKE
jgi:hypothetical protein